MVLSSIARSAHEIIRRVKSEEDLLLCTRQFKSLNGEQLFEPRPTRAPIVCVIGLPDLHLSQ
jgi:hypothetical protein